MSTVMDTEHDMSTAITHQTQGGLPRTLQPDEVDLIKRTICKGASDDELKLFLHQCNRTQLDPFSKQIHAIKRWDSRERREIMTIQVGIDGLRIIAERSEQMDGQEGPYWCGPDGEWKDCWLSQEPPVGAKVMIFRKGRSHPYAGFARFSAYAQTKKEGGLNTFWTRMPDVMIAKCAEALALRKAFPNDLSGLYIAEEMGEVENPSNDPDRLPSPTSNPQANGGAPKTAQEQEAKPAPDPVQWFRKTIPQAPFAKTRTPEDQFAYLRAEIAKRNFAPDVAKELGFLWFTTYLPTVASHKRLEEIWHEIDSQEFTEEQRTKLGTIHDASFERIKQAAPASIPAGSEPEY